MLPIAIDPVALRIGLAGAQEPLERRRRMLAEGGVTPLPVTADSALDGLHLLLVAGLDRASAEALARRARAKGVLVNVEDAPQLCDFHIPATIRRGDLAISVSTAGRAPALARFLREWLERIIGPEWKARLDEVGLTRERWKSEGRSPAEISRLTRELAAREGWFR